MSRSFVVLLGLAACVGAPIDMYPAAARAVDAGELLRALAYLDQIPPAHPSYPDARTLAQAVERRMRRGQELVLRGLELRAQWRDEEALTCFEEAHAIWPSAVGVDTWIEATRGRIAAAATPTPSPPQGGHVQETRPVPEATDSAAPAVELAVAALPANESVAAPIVADPAPATPVATEVERPAAVAVVDLAQLEALIQAGDLQGAVEGLEHRLRIDPQEKASRARLVQVLHQRALLSYGRGWLDVAIADWSRLLELDSSHPQAQSFLRAAAIEQERRAATASTPPK